MAQIIKICEIILGKANAKYKIHNYTETAQDLKIASEILLQVENIVGNGTYDEEFTLDFDVHAEIDDYEEEEEEISCESYEESESTQSSESSQGWESLEIAEKENFTYQQMVNILEFYDSKRSDKFAKTQHRYPRVKQPNYISRFRTYVEQNGTKAEKFSKLENFVYSKFVSSRLQLACLRDEDLRRWGIQKAKELHLEFSASENWTRIFKKSFRIVSRKITKNVTAVDVRKAEEIATSAKEFVRNVKAEIAGYSSRNIFNTDQSGFSYEFAAARTLSFKGEKSTMGVVKSVNSTTHSYSIMPTISMEGGLCGKLLVCLQEKDSKFGPRVLEKLVVPPNIYLTCSKSGKLDKGIVRGWVENCLAPLTMEKMILILDSWSGQKDADLFRSVQDRCKCLQIPPKTTAEIQPLDRYFFRQYKIFRRRILERIIIDELDIDLKERNSLLKMHSLIFNQLQSESFKPMIRYSWFASGYTDDRAGTFLNLQEILFQTLDDECHEEMCDKSSFIRCAYCKLQLCFDHFFVENHFHT